MNIDVRIDGIPCQVDVATWGASRGYREPGGLQLEPDEPAGWEIDAVRDRNGRLAPWLEEKLEDDSIMDDLTDQIEQYLSSQQDEPY